MNENLTPEHMREASDALLSVVTSPQYLSIAAEINALPEEDREAATNQLMTVDALAERGLQIPQGLRISPRWFEPSAEGMASDTADVLAHEAAPIGGTLCTSVGVIVCVSYGSSV